MAEKFPGKLVQMPRCSFRVVAALLALHAAAGCGGSPTAPSPSPPTPGAAILTLSATFEPLVTTPAPGLLYRLLYQVHETSGVGAVTLTTQHFAMSDGTFNAALTTPRVSAGGTITVESTLSIYPQTTPAGHVVFTITYSDDSGRSGSATAEADIVPRR